MSRPIVYVISTTVAAVVLASAFYAIAQPAKAPDNLQQLRVARRDTLRTAIEALEGKTDQLSNQMRLDLTRRLYDAELDLAPILDERTRIHEQYVDQFKELERHAAERYMLGVVGHADALDAKEARIAAQIRMMVAQKEER